MHTAPQQEQPRIAGRGRPWLAVGVVILIILSVLTVGVVILIMPSVGRVFLANQYDPGGLQAAHGRIREGMTREEVRSFLPAAGYTAKTPDGEEHWHYPR